MIRKLLIMYAIFTLLFLLFYFIAFQAYQQQYIHTNILFLAEKVLLAKDGLPPRLENIGLVYPPLAFIPFWFSDNYLIISPIISALLLSFLFIFLVKRCQNSIYSMLTIIFFLLLNPLLLFLSTYRFEILSFFVLFTVSLIMLILHIEKGYSFYLFVGGLLLGVCFFLDFRSLFLIPFVVIMILLSTKGRDTNYKNSILIVKLAPIIFFTIAWLYLNWIFTGNPLNFITSHYSFFKSEPIESMLFSAKGKLLRSLNYTFLILIKYIPIILPYFFILFKFKKYNMFYSVLTYLLFLSPLFFLFFSIYFAVFFPAYYYAILFLLFALTFHLTFHSEHCQKKTTSLIFSFFLSLLSSWILPLYSKEENEKNFVRFLLTRNIKANLTHYKDTVRALKELNCEKILIDDSSAFPVVILYKQPKNFYLPYMYEYYTVLSYPWIFTDCVVVDKLNNNDIISKRFPKSTKGFLKGYSLSYEGERYNIFKKF